VLGDMLELGEHAPRLHAELAAPIAAAGVDRVFTVGQAMRHLRKTLPAAIRAAHGDDALAVLPALEAELRPGDVVLIKGSLGVAMGRLVEALAALPQEAAMATLPGE
jgi:UDP-N-acetylmuramyl pentapeptide synthase